MAQSFVTATDGADETLLYIHAKDSTGKELAYGYRIAINAQFSQEITLYSHGYISQKLWITPNVNYTIQMEANSFELNTVVVSDIHKTSTVSNSVLNLTKISAKKIEQLGATALADA